MHIYVYIFRHIHMYSLVVWECHNMNAWRKSLTTESSCRILVLHPFKHVLYMFLLVVLYKILIVLSFTVETLLHPFVCMFVCVCVCLEMQLYEWKILIGFQKPHWKKWCVVRASMWVEYLIKYNLLQKHRCKLKCKIKFANILYKFPILKTFFRCLVVCI